jgi:hypothetical protein
MRLGWGLGSTWRRREVVTVTEKLEERGVEGRIILKLILKNLNRMSWTEFIWVGVEKIWAVINRVLYLPVA